MGRLLQSPSRRFHLALEVAAVALLLAAAAAAAPPPPSLAPDEPEEADILRYGTNVLRSTDTLEQFNTEPAFPTLETLFLLGRAHDEGREDVGIKRDEDAARALYERAAKLGHPPSQHALSTLLAGSAGEGGEDVEAVLYDFFASLGGDPLAHAALGYRYLYGIGTPQSCQKSLAHYYMAAREVIADLHAEGRGGVSRNVDRTRLSVRFVAGRRPASDSDQELVDIWRAGAEIGDVGSIRVMGLLYQHGARGLDQDLEKSYEMYEKGAELSDAASMSFAANLQMRGAGTPIDYKAAYKKFLASKTTHVSLNGLGYLYLHGLGVKRDVRVAFDYFEQARREDKENQNPDILFNLGMMYVSNTVELDLGGSKTTIISGGESVTLSAKDTKKALAHLTAAAAMGHVEAMFQAAVLKADEAEEPLTATRCQSAVSLFKNVVERGPWMDGMQAALRRATAGDYGGALVLYSRLAEIGFEVAQSNAAWLLEAGHCSNSGGASANSTQVNCEKRALRLYEHAARQGRASAEMKVGNFHYHGKAGLPVDYEKAAERYLKASDANYAEALFGMGYMHQMGKGVPQDLFLAKRYFDQAALVSSDAVPVARLSLVLLRVQSAWMRWRDWWREIRADRAAGDGDGDGDGDDWVYGSQKEEEEGEVFSTTETVSLVALVMLLVMVMGERERRQRARRRPEGGAAAT